MHADVAFLDPGRGGGRAFSSPEQAGQALAGALSGALSGRGRTLLVVDDVWTAAQLQPFAAAGAARQAAGDHEAAGGPG